MSKLKFYTVRFSKLIITSPVWIPLITIGMIALIITYTGILIEGIGK